MSFELKLMIIVPHMHSFYLYFVIKNITIIIVVCYHDHQYPNDVFFLVQLFYAAIKDGLRNDEIKSQTNEEREYNMISFVKMYFIQVQNVPKLQLFWFIKGIFTIIYKSGLSYKDVRKSYMYSGFHRHFIWVGRRVIMGRMKYHVSVVPR